MSAPNLRDALFLRMAEILPTLELFTFEGAEERELAEAAKAWAEIKTDAQQERDAIREDNALQGEGGA